MSRTHEDLERIAKTLPDAMTGIGFKNVECSVKKRNDGEIREIAIVFDVPPVYLLDKLYATFTMGAYIGRSSTAVFFGNYEPDEDAWFPPHVSQTSGNICMKTWSISRAFATENPHIILAAIHSVITSVSISNGYHDGDLERCGGCRRLRVKSNSFCPKCNKETAPFPDTVIVPYDYHWDNYGDPSYSREELLLMNVGDAEGDEDDCYYEDDHYEDEEETEEE